MRCYIFTVDQKKIITFLLYLSLLVKAYSNSAITKPSNILVDFESGSRSEWLVEGTAFELEPVKGPSKNQSVEGFEGSYFANSFGPGGDGAKGRIISPSFVITQKYLTFLLGGGADPQGGNLLGAQLEVDGQVVRKATGYNSDAMRLKAWDLSDLQGRTGKIIIMDGLSGRWGHIMVDRFLMVPSLDYLLKPSAKGTVDLQGYIKAHLEGGSKNIVVPPGRYRVAPQGQAHLSFSKLDNIEIVMKGVEMVCTETTRAVNISECTKLQLTGLIIDYDPLPFTQGRITAIGPNKEWLEFELLKGYPENQLEIRIEIFDVTTGELKVPTRYDWQPLEKIGDRKYRVRRGNNYKGKPETISEEIGDFLVTNNNFTPGGQIPHVIVGRSNTECVIQDVIVYASNCFSFLENDCDKTTYLRCRLDRRALQDDPIQREWMRLRSGNADAFHSIDAKRGPQIISSQGSYMGDDGVNIRGHYAMVVSGAGNTIRILGKKPDLRKDDPLELMTYSGVRLPDGVLIGEPEPDGKSSPEIAAFFSKQHMHESLRKGFSNPEIAVWKITVREPVNLPIGSVICSKNRIGNGFLVKDSTFGPNRSRGILIKGSNGGVIGNTCRGNWGNSILVAPEWWWQEAGSSDNLRITDNKISDCRDTSICIQAGAGSGGSSPAGAHNQIMLLNNTIQTDRLPALRVTSLEDGAVKGNNIITVLAGETIVLENNKNVVIQDNNITQP